MNQWKIDPVHSAATFTVRHMMITDVRGVFETLEGSLIFDPANPKASQVMATIEAKSINTRMAPRDEHLRNADFLDADNHPIITFKSTSIELNTPYTGSLNGMLTMRGITNHITLDVTFMGISKDPFTGQEKAGFLASGKINREAWGMMWNVLLDTGGILVGREVQITLDVQATREAETPTQIQQANSKQA
jgi:polyisoprenoid-binding protein YceI